MDGARADFRRFGGDFAARHRRRLANAKGQKEKTRFGDVVATHGKEIQKRYLQGPRRTRHSQAALRRTCPTNEGQLGT